jgi:hypothetical protein
MNRETNWLGERGGRHRRDTELSLASPLRDGNGNWTS